MKRALFRKTTCGFFRVFTHVHGQPSAADVHVLVLVTFVHEPHEVAHVVGSLHSDQMPPVTQHGPAWGDITSFD